MTSPEHRQRGNRALHFCPLCQRLVPAGPYAVHQGEHVRALLAEGLSQSAIARQLGVTRQRVGQIIKEPAA